MAKSVAASLVQARKLYSVLDAPGDAGDKTLMKCPTCQVVLEVLNFRRGPLDRDRGIHQTRHYGWVAWCPTCDTEWGSYDTRDVPSLWVLRDRVEGESCQQQKSKKN